MRSDRRLSRCGLWGVVAGLVLLCLAGCGSKKYYPVRGQLVYADTKEPVKELAGYEVYFSSEKLRTYARGTIQEDGSFQLGTEKDNDGAAPGEYVVTVTQGRIEPDRERPKYDRPVEEDYEDPAKSKLKAEVKQEDNKFTFELRRRVKPRK